MSRLLDVEQFRTQAGALAADADLEPSERVSALRRLRDLVDMARDQARQSLGDQLDMIATLTSLIGEIDTYMGDNELRREAEAMDRTLTLARMRENADLRDQLLAQGTDREQLDEMGLFSHDELDALEEDGKLEEAAFGLAANFREWMVKRNHGKFATKMGAGGAPAAPAAPRPAMPKPAKRGAERPRVPTPAPAAAPAPAAPVAPPESPGVLGMGGVTEERMNEIDDSMRGMIQPGEDERPEQSFAGSDELFATAEADFGPFKKLLAAAAKKLNGKAPASLEDAVKAATDHPETPQLVMGPLKKMERARQKVDTKYEGDWNRLQDVVRATFVVPTLADMPTAIESIREQAKAAGWEIKKAENRFLDPPPPSSVGPTAAGYRDAAVALVSPQGLVTELQLNTSAMFVAKQEKGHELYEQSREIEARIKARGGAPTDAERAELASLDEQSKQLYQSAWESSYA